MLVREKPPLRLDIDIETPGGRHVHWSEQEHDPADVPSSVRFGSTMPGGHADFDATLPRKRGLSYSDVERLSTVTVYGPGGAIAWQGRLERAPRSSGDQLSVSPGCVGWQAHLEDDKSAGEIYVDSGVGNWGDTPRAERLRIATANLPWGQDYTVSTDQGLSFQGNTGKAIPNGSRNAAAYLCPAGLAIAKVMYRGTRQNTTSVTSDLRVTDGGDWATEDAYTPTWDDTLRTQSLTTARRNLQLLARATATHTPAAGSPFGHQISKLAVYGNHSVATRANDTDPDGVYSSDVIADVLGRWCPLLNYTAGETIQADTFVIPHLVFRERTTPAEILKGAARFNLYDWGVWDNRTFYYAPRGTFGRSWRARSSESDLQETGADMARLWNGVIVEYRDVDGTTRTVGPQGSGSDLEGDELLDTDPENPANKLGIRRWTKIQMGTSTIAGAAQVGFRFLEETKALDHSGQARIVGHCVDDKGVTRPAWQIRAGDTISFTDASDFSPRRVVSAQYDHASRTCSVDLDAPPDSLAAILERLDVAVAPLGL